MAKTLKQLRKKGKDLPAVLVMKRKAIRQFPNGQKVALYHVDKLNKYITIPYDKDAIISVSEEIAEE